MFPTNVKFLKQLMCSQSLAYKDQFNTRRLLFHLLGNPRQCCNASGKFTFNIALIGRFYTPLKKPLAAMTISTQTNPNSRGKGKAFSWKHQLQTFHVFPMIQPAGGWFRQRESFIKFDFGTRILSGFQHLCKKNIWNKRIQKIHFSNSIASQQNQNAVVARQGKIELPILQAF